MSRSQNSFIKKQKEKRKQEKKVAKAKRKKERQENNAKGSPLEDMMAYIDKNGTIVSEQPESE